MKVFLVRGGSCAEDVTDAVRAMPGIGAGMTAGELEGILARIPVPIAGDRYVSAPDRVWPGWGFDPEKGGDERFMKPRPPAGWRYDDKSGTLYRAEGRRDETEGPSGCGVGGKT